MMAVVGEIAVNVTAKTNKFNAGMKKAGSSVKRFSKTAKRSMAIVRGSIGKLGLLVGAGSLGGLAVAFTRVAKSIDQVAKDAVRLGIVTEQLQALNFAAGIFGASSEDITKAIQKQQKTISEANLGLLTQKRAFDQLGISMGSLEGSTADQTFFRIATAMKEVRSETDQARIAQDIFGRGGQKLLTLFRANDAEIRKQLKTFREFNSAFSAEEAAKVEAFNDELLKLKTAFGGELNKLVITAAPEAITLVKGLQAWIREAVKLAGIVVTTAGDGGDGDLPPIVAGRRFERQKKIEELEANRERLRAIEAEQIKGKIFNRALGSAGRGILGTLRGATKTSPADLFKLRDTGTELAKGFTSGLRSRTLTELTTGRFKRDKGVADAERKRNDAALTKQFEQGLKDIGTQGQSPQTRAANRIIDATSAEGLAAIRKGRRPTEKLETLTKQHIEETKKLGELLGRQEEFQQLVSGV